MSEDSSGGSVRRFIGLVLAVIGGLWVVSSGLCGAWSVVSLLTSESAYYSEVYLWVLIALVISGISAAMGYGVYVVGRGLRGSK